MTRKIIIDFIFILTIEMKINIVLLETRACHTYTIENCKNVDSYDTNSKWLKTKQLFATNAIECTHTDSMHKMRIHAMDKMQTNTRKKKQNSQKENVMNCGVVNLVFVVASDDAHKSVSFLCYNIFHNFSSKKKNAIEQSINSNCYKFPNFDFIIGDWWHLFL